MPSPIRILYAISLVSALLSLAAHLATFTSLGANQDFLSYSLGLLLMLVVLLFVTWPTIVWLWRRMPKRNMVSEIFGGIPRWMKVSVVTLFVYFVVNFILCRSLTDGGLPVVLKDGRHVLQSGDKIIRELNPEQFAWAQGYQVRLLTGHLLVFYSLAVLAIRAIWIKSGTSMASKNVEGP